MISCRFESGNAASLRHVTTDALVMRNDNSEILLTKRAPHLKSGGMWALIGGYLERDETASEGLTREILEETGYQSQTVELFRVNTNPHRKGEDTQNVTFVFVVTAGEQTGEPDDETSELRWFPIDAVPSQDEIAFDHYENITQFRDWQAATHALPIINV